MTTKGYSVRAPQSAPDVTSEEVAAWLDSQLASNAPLWPDPGAGDKTLRLSLEQEKVERGARAASEPEAVFLRRLIATHTGLGPEQRKEEPEEAKPHPPVLKGALKLRTEQVKPVVHAVERLQSFAITRVMRCPQAAEMTRYTEEEREQLSTGLAECVNRRATVWLIDNVDWIGLSLNFLSIEFAKIDAARAVAERGRAARAKTITVKPAAATTARQPAPAPVSKRPEGESLDNLPDAINWGEPYA